MSEKLMDITQALKQQSTFAIDQLEGSLSDAHELLISQRFKELLHFVQTGATLACYAMSIECFIFWFTVSARDFIK